MKDERVIELWNAAAQECPDGLSAHMIVRFAGLVAAETREECAKVFEGDWGLKAQAKADVRINPAEAIRALGYKS